MIPPINLPPNWNPDPDKAWQMLKAFTIVFVISFLVGCLSLWLWPMAESFSKITGIIVVLIGISAFSAAAVSLLPISISLPFASMKLFRRNNPKE